VPNAGHSLNRCAVCGTSEAGDLNLEAQQLDALRSVVDPFFAGLKVILDTLEQFVRNSGKFGLVDVVDEVVEPSCPVFAFCLLQWRLLVCSISRL
jgi:hypothetical protein